MSVKRFETLKNINNKNMIAIRIGKSNRVSNHFGLVLRITSIRNRSNIFKAYLKYLNKIFINECRLEDRPSCLKIKIIVKIFQLIFPKN